VNVFTWRDGFFTAQQIHERYPRGLDGRHLAWMFKRVLEVLGHAHAQGWVHGAVLPPHLMFHAVNHGLQLVDWIHARPVHSPLVEVPTRFQGWYPAECFERRGATPATDIYLAAKSMLYLAGGDAPNWADDVPTEILQFFETCLLESQAMRPQCTSQLHDEFSQLLESVYGPPEYHELHMT
jgi:hypothetical protein